MASCSYMLQLMTKANTSYTRGLDIKHGGFA
jgi:hypothetical protein